MTTVIDIGCAQYGGDFSLERLAMEFKPDKIIGLDPNWNGEMRCETGVPTFITAAAAWTHDGTVTIRRDGLYSEVDNENGTIRVPCFDLAKLIVSQDDQRIILKIDAEGSEYVLLKHLIEHRADALLELAWVEWHAFGVEDPAAERAAIERDIACELIEWNW